MGLLVGFLPWILFAVLRAMDQLAPALLVALACSVYTVASKRAKVLDWTSLAFFSALAVLVLVLGHKSLLPWTSTLSNGTLALMAWGGLLAGRPFTVAYAKEHVPPELWGSPGFRAVNRHITAVWALSFTVQAVSALLLFEGRTTTWVDEALSIAAIVVALQFTSRYPAWYRARHGGGGAARGGPEVPPSSHRSAAEQPASD